MNKICTTIEQFKKLLELGIDVYTADMFYNEEQDETCLKDIVDTKYPMVIREGQKHYLEEYGIPAWSLSALLGLMPFHIIENNVRYGFQMVKGLDKEGETYKIKYEGYTSLVETLMYNNLIDAAFEMVCWLKENGKI